MGKHFKTVSEYTIPINEVIEQYAHINGEFVEWREHIFNYTLTNLLLAKRMGGRMELIENGICERKSMMHRFDK